MDATPQEVTENATALDSKGPEAPEKKRRILLAVGDLHGDYFRLLRHLRELGLLLPDTLAWNPEMDNVDLILIGDYVDWRGEVLEPALDQSPPHDDSTGARRTLELIMHIEAELQLLHEKDSSFDSHFYPLLGNHDDMMLESVKIFEFISVPDLMEHLAKSKKGFPAIKRQLSDAGFKSEQIEEVLRFLNWYVQGGETTMRGFGGMQAWKDAMDGELGRFLRNRLHLAVVVNKRLFAHTVPDSPKFWRPLDDIVNLPDSEYAEAKEAFMWSRKVWGYDYYTGMRTSPFSERDLEQLLAGLECDSVVIGHTPLSRGTEPIVAYGGKVTNIDVHGAPGARAFLEEYNPQGITNKAPLRS